MVGIRSVTDNKRLRLLSHPPWLLPFLLDPSPKRYVSPILIFHFPSLSIIHISNHDSAHLIVTVSQLPVRLPEKDTFARAALCLAIHNQHQSSQEAPEET
jgi:hypothetical protein